MKTRIEYALSLFVCLALTAGCAAYSDMKKQDDFSETTKSYEKMIFWSNYDTADSFRDPQERETHPADIDELKNIKVTSYSVKKVTVSEDQAEVRQIVEIGYYRVIAWTKRHRHGSRKHRNRPRRRAACRRLSRHPAFPPPAGSKQIPIK